jgi:hypothetical protein
MGGTIIFRKWWTILTCQHINTRLLITKKVPTRLPRQRWGSRTYPQKKNYCTDNPQSFSLDLHLTTQHVVPSSRLIHTPLRVLYEKPKQKPNRFPLGPSLRDRIFNGGPKGMWTLLRKRRVFRRAEKLWDLQVLKWL